MEKMLTEEGQYIVRQQREMQDFREMMGAQLFAYYTGDAQDPDGLDNLVDSLENKVQLGLADYGEIIKNASPEVSRALQNRMAWRIKQMRTYIATDYTKPDRPIDWNMYNATEGMGYKTLEQQTGLARQRNQQIHIEEGRRDEQLHQDRLELEATRAKLDRKSVV